MMHFLIVLAFLLTTLSASTKGHAQPDDAAVRALLDRPNAPSVIDRMDEMDRQRAIRNLMVVLYNQPSRLDVAQLLCAVRPWRMEDPSDEDSLQRIAWAQMALLPSYSPLFRWLDCVAINRAEKGYRAVSLTPFYDLRQAACTGIPISDDMPTHLSLLAERIQTFDRKVAFGLASAMKDAGQAPQRYSFYPLRNAFRLALLGAAEAVEKAKNGDGDATRAAFGDAADVLRAYISEDFPYAEARNGWTQHNDRAFYIAFYDWLAGRGQLDLSKLIEWPPALDDPVIVNAIPPATIREIRAGTDGDYIDPIYVERLLPGANADSSRIECDGWRRRSYNPRTLAKHVQECASAFRSAPLTSVELKQLDLCLGEYEAKDWRVQFMSLSPDRVQRGIEAADAMVADITSTERFGELQQQQRERISQILEDLDTEVLNSQFTRIVTKYALHTSDRVELERIFDELESDLNLDDRPLLARKRIY